jgi:parvulin-like peptidyl-prolyl isomerase
MGEGFSLSEEEMLLVKNYEKRLLIQKYIDTRLSHNYRILDQEVEDYYNKHQREFVWDDETVHIIHLVLENDDSAIKSEIRQSKDLMDVIKKNFFDQQSTPERPIGDLGYHKLNEFPNTIQRRIKNLKTGNISGPIKTNYGYHYIQLLDYQKKGAIKDLDIARDEIYMRLQLFKRDEEIDNIKQSLRSRFTIQTDLSKLSEH